MAGIIEIKRLPFDHYKCVMKAARKVFPPDNEYGVFSFGIRSKIRKGISMRYSTLSVTVERKNKKAVPSVPAIEYNYKEQLFQIVPDVKASGSRPFLYQTGEIPYNGLHAGGAIKVANGSGDVFGGIACLLSQGGGLSHFLTAGHLFDRGEKETAVYCGDHDQREVLTSHLVANLLRRPPGEDGQSIDAALVELTDEGIELALASRGDGPSLTSIGLIDEGVSLTVQSFLPTCNDYSNQTSAAYSNEVTHFGSRGGWHFTVSGVIKTERLITRAGDSGTILFSPYGRKAFGSCIGEFDRLSFFAPIQRTISKLAEMGYRLRLCR